MKQQILDARQTLRQLQQGIAEAERRFVDSPAARLLEANERLVLATLRAQTEADTASNALQEVARTAELDPLTALPNRLLVLDRLAHAISKARRLDSRVALLFIDLDDFKHINDTFGHPAGDQVLRQVAQCIAATVRQSDTVGRIGGDEFMVVLDDIANTADALAVAGKVIAALTVASRIGDLAVQLGASIGISLYPEDGVDADTLIDRADFAMYQAKRRRLGVLTYAATSSVAPAEMPAVESTRSPAAGGER